MGRKSEVASLKSICQKRHADARSYGAGERLRYVMKPVIMRLVAHAASWIDVNNS